MPNPVEFLMSPPPVAIIGVFRSGTNATKALVDQAFATSAVFDSVFWKHTVLPTPLLPSTLAWRYIVVVKDPFHQLVSWYRYASKNRASMRGGKTWEMFIKRPLKISMNFETQPTYFYPHPLAYWNQYYQTIKAITLTHGNFKLVRYEDVVMQKSKTLSEISKFLDTPVQDEDAKLPLQKLKNMKGQKKFEPDFDLRGEEFDFSVVQDRSFMSEFGSEQIEWVKRRIAPQLTELYGHVDKKR